MIRAIKILSTSTVVLQSTLLVFFIIGNSFLAGSVNAATLKEVQGECDAGVTQACLDLGVVYSLGEHKGKKVKKDKAKARRYIKEAVKRGQQNCLQGDSFDCYTLGLLFFEGGGVVPTDIPRGLDFLQRSCKGGYQKACSWLDNSGLRGIR